MDISEKRNLIRWAVSILALVTVMVILWNVYTFFEQLKTLERKNIKEIAYASELLDTSEDNRELFDVYLFLSQNNTTTPVIQENIDGQLSAVNLPEEIINDSLALRQLVEAYKTENEPVVLYDNKGNPYTHIYYGNSDVVNNLKYFPLALLLVIVLFLTVIYFFFRSTRVSEQNKLWAGMAKESAHQIGTPLSSLVGWTTLLKETDVDPSYIVEMEKDIHRLETITTRFSKIGSLPTLSPQDIVKQTREAVAYIQSRSSDLITFDIQLPNKKIPVMMNVELYSWTIENLVKNGIDAMRGKGAIAISLTEDKKYVRIKVSDQGKGIPKNKWKTVFEPGYTTKKRGWGLGLSLAKRIIKDFHRGQIKVLESTSQDGTVFCINLRKL